MHSDFLRSVLYWITSHQQDTRNIVKSILTFILRAFIERLQMALSFILLKGFWEGMVTCSGNKFIYYSVTRFSHIASNFSNSGIQVSEVDILASIYRSASQGLMFVC